MKQSKGLGARGKELAETSDWLDLTDQRKEELLVLDYLRIKKAEAAFEEKLMKGKIEGT